MSVQRRIERLEQRHGEAVDAAYRRLLAQLSDEDLAAIAETGRVPAGLQLPDGLVEYEPPAGALLRVWELATPQERRLQELVEPAGV